jgi:hypothetical protein
MYRGYVKVWRKLQDTAFYKNANCVQMAIHLLMKASHDPKPFLWNGKMEVLQPGEILTGRKVLASETGQSEQEVRTSLSILCDPTIYFSTIKSTNKFSVISICKYEEYQENQPALQPTSNQQATNKQPTSNHIQTLRSIKKHEKETTTSVEFDTFWAAYPRKTGKDCAAKSWSTKKPPLDKCLSTLAWQITCEQWVKEGGKYIPMPATWINQGRWLDEPLNAKPIPIAYKQAPMAPNAEFDKDGNLIY